MEGFTQKEKCVLAFATKAHGEQKRKYTGEPYITHPIAVAKLVKEYGGDTNQVMAALLHDVVEDTPLSNLDVFISLCEMGISIDDANDICELVFELTDEFTKDFYPQFNRAQRKLLEADRLGKSSARVQLIKACDLIDNTKSIVSNDPKFAKVYLKEKEMISDLMMEVPTELYNELTKNE